MSSNWQMMLTTGNNSISNATLYSIMLACLACHTSCCDVASILTKCQKIKRKAKSSLEHIATAKVYLYRQRQDKQIVVQHSDAGGQIIVLAMLPNFRHECCQRLR